jgi:tripartite-type tricarboxylate transporter receptor subunit TctC
MRGAKATVAGMFAVWALCCAPGYSQPFPSKTVRVIVPYPAGGTTDIVARVVAQKLSSVWGRQVVIDNRAGAGGNIGKEIAARSPADGYTILMSGVSFAINPGLYKKIPYDPENDFLPITQVASTPQILEVHPSLPANSVKELIALARARPGQLFYGSAGSGTTLHLSAELFDSMTGIKMTHVPYKGVTAALMELMSGQVQVIFDSQPSSLPYIKAGKLKGLAVTSAKRAVALPELPTIMEAGVPGYEATSWYGTFVPAGTAQDIYSRLQTDFMSVIRMPEVQSQLLAQGAEPVGGTPEQFAKLIREELAKWAKVVKTSGARVD